MIFILLIFAASQAHAQPEYTDAELAEKFAPEVILHSQEKYEPINAEWFIQNSKIRKKSGNVDNNNYSIVEDSPDVSELHKYDSEEYYMDLPDEYHESYEQYEDSAQKTVYYRVKDVEGGKMLQYWFFYPYSAWNPSVSGFDTLGEHSTHESDWEMVQYYLAEDKHLFPIASSYAQHYIGKKSHWTQQNKEEVHPQVYPSRNGHATYYGLGEKNFECVNDAGELVDVSITDVVPGFTPISIANGRTDCTGAENAGGGEIISPSEYSLANLEEQSWIGYQIGWGEDDHSGPMGKEDFYGNNVWSNPIDWAQEREPYESGALQPDYTPPSGNLEEPEEVNPEEQVTFNAQGSDDSGYVEFHWNVNGDSEVSDSDIRRTFDSGGDYTVSVNIVDNEGASVSEEILYHVNKYPVPEFSLLQDTVKTFEQVDVEESSSDPDGIISEVLWEFGQEQVSGSNPEISFEDDGTYDVELSVTDDDNLENSITKTIEVLNREPNVEFSYSPQEVYYDTQVEFTSDSSDRDGRIVENRWTVDNDAEVESQELSKTFNNATGGVSTYEVGLEVEDDDGATDSTTKTIEIANRKPSAEFEVNSTEIRVGGSIEFNSLANDRDGQIKEIDWDLGDGGISSEESFEYTYTEAGTYTVEHEVTDSAGEKSSQTTQITVESKTIGEKVFGDSNEDSSGASNGKSDGVIGSLVNSILGFFR